MRRMIGVTVVLLSLGLAARPAEAQSQGSTVQNRAGALLPNYPNPFNPETTIPFVLDPELFEGGGLVRVSIRILNLMLQPVAIPTALNHPAGNRPGVLNLEFTTPGRHEAYWDGLDMNGRKVASAPYLVQLEVNGRHRGLMKILVKK